MTSHRARHRRRLLPTLLIATCAIVAPAAGVFVAAPSAFANTEGGPDCMLTDTGPGCPAPWGSGDSGTTGDGEGDGGTDAGSTNGAFRTFLTIDDMTSLTTTTQPDGSLLSTLDARYNPNDWPDEQAFKDALLNWWDSHVTSPCASGDPDCAWAIVLGSTWGELQVKGPFRHK